MPEQIPLTLTRQELDQLLEALLERAESWERIAESLRDSRSRTSEGGSGNGSPGGAGYASYRQRPEVTPGDATLQGSEESAPEGVTDEILESRRFCMQSMPRRADGTSNCGPLPQSHGQNPGAGRSLEAKKGRGGHRFAQICID